MPTRLFMSSGDLVADRRYDFARALQSRGDLEAAADLMAQAADLAPGFASAWFALGELRQLLNQHDDAIVAFRQALAADAEDRHGAGLRLMRLGAHEVAAMPTSYVRMLFDQYAPRFEASLVGELGYRGPELLRDAVRAARLAQKLPPHLARAIDLGCGTGLAARAFASHADAFVGIDLSERMIALARGTGCYAELVVADMAIGLAAQPDASADLILVADAFVYVCDPAPIIADAARVLRANGLIAFTVETHDGERVAIGAGLRYAHGAGHIREAVAAAGLRLCSLTGHSARNEDGVPAPGLVAVAAKDR